MEHPDQGAAKASSEIDRDHFSKVRSYKTLGFNRAIQGKNR